MPSDVLNVGETETQMVDYKRGKMKKSLLICLSIASVLLVAVPAFAYDMVVDLANKYRPVTHLASGSLYGLKQDGQPADKYIAPTRPFMFTQPAANGEHAPYDYGRPVGDILDTAAMAHRNGATVTMRMADTFPTWPYHFVSVWDWRNRVNNMINDWLASGHGNLYAYEIYNEPDLTYDGGSIISFNDLWKLTYDIIRQRDPEAKIMGPSTTSYNAYLESFLTWARNNNCYPDIVSWHELTGAWNVQGAIDSYKQLQQRLGISRPVSINEYVASFEDGRPGKITDYIATFERNREVESACLPFWSTAGSMGNILTHDFQPNGAWHVFKWYGDMNGSMVWTQDPESMIDGFSSINAAGDKAYAIFGGADNQRIILTGFSNTALGNKVHVYAEYTEWVGINTVYNNTKLWFERDYEVVNNRLTLDVNNMNEFSAYRLTITPASQSPDACRQWSATLNQHVSAGRAYTETSGGCISTTTYFAVGSGENLGTFGNAVLTLYTDDNGRSYRQGGCPVSGSGGD